MNCGEWYLLKYFPREHSDGQVAMVDVMSMPAKFYRVVALSGPNSVGETKPGFILETGSGHWAKRWALETANAIANGMVSLGEEEK